MWQCWTRNLSLIPLQRRMYLYDEPIMSIYWYSYHVQSYIGLFLGETATKLLNFDPNRGLAWYNMVRLDKKSVFDPSPKTHAPL